MCVLFPKTNIWFHASVLLNHSGACLLFFLLHRMRHPGSSTNPIKCKDVGLLNGTPRFIWFFLKHGGFFVWRKKNYTQFWCWKKGKKMFIWETSFSLYPLTQRSLSFAITVICSTFVKIMFLINVHRHECQYNCKRFNYGYKQGTTFFGGKKWLKQKGGRKRTGLHLRNNLLSCKQLNLYCTFSQFFEKYISYISCVLNIKSCLCNVVS